MEVIKQNDSWVIGTNFGTIDTGGIRGTRSRDISRLRKTYEVWTGQRWWGQFSAAKLFASQEEAEQYLQENWQVLEESLSSN